MLALHCWLFVLLVLASYAAGSLINDILKAFEQAVDCESCHALLTLLQVLALLGDSAFIKTLIAICQTLKVSTTASYV
jgi:sphingomyelin phosphodiesterase